MMPFQGHPRVNAFIEAPIIVGIVVLFAAITGALFSRSERLDEIHKMKEVERAK
jgi:hypothetical protein